MMNQEQELLRIALLYENGHKRRTEHILKVYALASSIGTVEGCSKEELGVLKAAAILHDISIKRCKEKYGDASQKRQREEAPVLVKKMLEEAGYAESLYEAVLYLVLHHHEYTKPKNNLLQFLIEADLLVNFMEDPEHISQVELGFIFQTAYGNSLRDIFLRHENGGR